MYLESASPPHNFFFLLFGGFGLVLRREMKERQKRRKNFTHHQHDTMHWNDCYDHIYIYTNIPTHTQIFCMGRREGIRLGCIGYRGPGFLLLQLFFFLAPTLAKGVVESRCAGEYRSWGRLKAYSPNDMELFLVHKSHVANKEKDIFR